MINSPSNFFDQIKNLCEEQALQLKAVLNKFSSYLTGSEIEETYLKKTDASSQYLGKTAKASSASTADLATKATQDSSGNNIVNTYATKNSVTESLTSKADKAHTHSVGDVSNLSTSLNAKLDISTYNADKTTFLTTGNVYTKSEVDAKVSAVYRFKSSVASEANLPKSGNTIGDVYNVNDTGANYAWNGSTWDKLSETIDLTPYLKSTDAANTYLKSSDAASTYLKTSDAANTYLGKTAKAVSATSADSATKATQDGSGNTITSTYLTKTDASNTYLGKTAKASSATTADSATKATQDGSGNNIEATYAKKSEIPEVDTSALVPKTGDRGLLKGYEQSVLAGDYYDSDDLEITADMPDCVFYSGKGLISAYSSEYGTAWTKVIYCVGTPSSVYVSGVWSWAGNGVPSLSDGDSIFVFHWNNLAGVVNYIPLTTAE